MLPTWQEAQNKNIQIGILYTILVYYIIANIKDIETCEEKIYQKYLNFPRNKISIFVAYFAPLTAYGVLGGIRNI